MGDIHILSLFSNGCLKGADMGIGYFNNKLYLFHKSVCGLSTQRHTHLAVGGFRVLAPKPYLHVSMYTAFH